MFTYRAMNRRSTTSPEGHLQMKEDCVGDDMLSRWAALRARDPEKMSMTDVMVALATNVCPFFCTANADGRDSF